MFFHEVVMSKSKISISQKKLDELYRHWNIVEFAIFGFALREDFTPESNGELHPVQAVSGHFYRDLDPDFVGGGFVAEE